MNQAIFEMGLSVEATSLYLVLVHLSDTGATMNRETAERIWNAGDAALDQAVAELLERGVIGQNPEGVWHITPTAGWKKA